MRDKKARSNIVEQSEILEESIKSDSDFPTDTLGDELQRNNSSVLQVGAGLLAAGKAGLDEIKRKTSHVSGKDQYSARNADETQSNLVKTLEASV